MYLGKFLHALTVLFPSKKLFILFVGTYVLQPHEDFGLAFLHPIFKLILKNTYKLIINKYT